MIKFIRLEGNIAYRYGVVDYIPDNADEIKKEYKIDRLITKDEYKKLFSEREHTSFDFLF